MRLPAATLLFWILANCCPPAVAGEPLPLDCTAGATSPLPSQWQQYFGIHYTRAAGHDGPWFGTVRGYGGPHVGLQQRPADWAEAPERVGPFTGRKLRLDLDDLRRASASRDGGMDHLVDELLEHNLTGIYVFTSIVRPTTGTFDKDTAYWAARLVYEKSPRAARQVLFQLGNEINGLHFDPLNYRERVKQGENKWKFSNRPEKIPVYVEHYFAPAVEAIRRAAADVYGDASQVRILSGSFANIYNPKFREWMRDVMNSRIEGKQAASLAGTRVWESVDVLTVHYPFGSRKGVDVMQEIHDEYLKPGKVSAVWITEDHGNGGRGTIDVLVRGMRFLEWVSANKLNADQARLVWWGIGARDPSGPGIEAVNMLGRWLAGAPLRFAHLAVDGGHAYVLLRPAEKTSQAVEASPERLLVVLVPGAEGALAADGVLLRLPEKAQKRPWKARAVKFSLEGPPAELDCTVEPQDSGLLLGLQTPAATPTAIVVEPAGTE